MVSYTTNGEGFCFRPKQRTKDKEQQGLLANKGYSVEIMSRSGLNVTTYSPLARICLATLGQSDNTPGGRARLTTVAYTHPSDEDMRLRIRSLAC